MEFIKLNRIEHLSNGICYVFSTSTGLSKYFSGKDFIIEYPEDISTVPDSVLAIPFVCNILPIIWLEDAELVVPELDMDFYNSIPKFKQGYIDMYPEAQFEGKIIVTKLVNCRQDKQDKSLAFFSGGVDATTTLLRHIDEKPILVTLWGADIAFDNDAGWNEMYPVIEKTARNYDLSCCYIRTSFRKFDIEGALHKKYIGVLGKGWWYGVKHGIGIISHVAPLVWLHNVGKVYFASSNCPEDGTKVKCASDPRIDNKVRFCGARVFHDGFELNRQKKVGTIVDFHKAHKEIPIRLHVCWESSAGKNCCHCEKCFRTMVEFWAEGEEPKEYGFNYNNEVFDEIYQLIALQCNNIAKNTWTYAKNRMAENWDSIKHEKYAHKLKWILRFDFKNLEDNRCRKNIRNKERIKRVIWLIAHPHIGGTKAVKKDLE